MRKNIMTKKIYLASPYSDPNYLIEEQRFSDVCREVAKLMNSGYVVFSPIAHCHPVAKISYLPTDYSYWKDFGISFIEWCDELWILMLDGWEKSKGIQGECETAKMLNRPIRYIISEDFFTTKNIQKVIRHA